MSTIVRSSTAYEPNLRIIVTLGGIEYYLDRSPAHAISFQPSYSLDEIFSGVKADLIPCTVFNGSKEEFNSEDLLVATAELDLHDDVWTPAFLQSETSYHF